MLAVQDFWSYIQFKRAIEPEKNAWLPDLTGDGIHDWHDLTVEKDEIWKLEDKNSDGYADQSSRILNEFNQEVTDVAGGLLVRKKDAFVAIGPDLWRLDNIHKKGLWTNPKSIATGFAVHIGFGGHGMSSVIEGPDGKIYWQIGDIGANITTVDGRNLPNPNSGVLVRSNADGTDLEIVASGIRNTHEFVFDHYGTKTGKFKYCKKQKYLYQGNQQGRVVYVGRKESLWISALDIPIKEYNADRFDKWTAVHPKDIKKI